jgi:pimeloyl-ACP methyl ester carboxylesterase
MSAPHPLHLLRRQPDLDQLLKSSYMLFFQLRWLPEAWLYFPWQPLVRTLWKRWSPDLNPSTETIAIINQCLKDSGPAPFSYYRNLVPSLGAAAFGNVHVPLFYMHGRNDGCLRADLVEGQERYFKAGYREHVFPGAGHFLQLEVTDELGELLGDWFDS